MEIDPWVTFKAQKGKRKSFGQLVEYYHQKVFQVSLMMTGNVREAETLAEDIFVEAYLRINNYDLDEKFSLWLYRMAANQLVDHLKECPPRHLEGETQRPQDMDQSILTALPVQQRLVITFRYIIQLPLTEICTILHIPLLTVQLCSRVGLEYVRKHFAPIF